MMRWLKEGEPHKITRRDLVDPGPGLVMLNRKPADALVATRDKAFQHLRAQRAAKNGLLGGRETLLETRCPDTRPNSTSDIVSITWLGDLQKAAARSLWLSRMARVKNGVPKNGKAEAPEVLHTAIKQCKGLYVEMMLFDQRDNGHAKPKHARKWYNSLLRVLDEAIIAEREQQNQETWQHTDKRHLVRIRNNAPAKPAAPAPQNSLGKRGTGKGAKSGKGKGKGDARRARISRPKRVASLPERAVVRGPAHASNAFTLPTRSAPPRSIPITHAYPEYQARDKELYRNVAVRSQTPAPKRSQPPTANNSAECRAAKRGNCHQGSSCKSAHTSSGPPALRHRVTLTAWRRALGPRRARRGRSYERRACRLRRREE